jgi:large subunit ribosomal protein L17
MRHNKKFNHLSRTASHRSAMLANMAISLIEHKRITTTVAKAKALKKYVEPLITKAKDDSTNSRRVVFSYLQNKEAIKELFGEVAQKVGDRPGGYTRIIKLGHRQGDAADICFIELVDFDENMAKAPKAAKILIYHFMLFSDEKITLENNDVEGNQEFDEEILHMRQLLKTKLIDMNLSVRALNCLKAADVETLGDLVQYNKTDLLKFRNFGKKSLSELDDLLESLNLSFGTDIAKYKLDKD